MSRGRVFAVVALLALSGCAVPGSPGLDTDRELGHVGDYAHDDVFEFDASDGLTEAQLEAVKYRSMARIEVVRGLKYERDVDLEVISRDEYREQRADAGNASAFTNEVWRGAFVVDGETDVNRAFDDLYGGSILGYYVNDRIVIITDDTDEIRIDREILVHELTHALQDQRFGIARESETIDGLRAENGLIEGEAGYVPERYDRRCGGEWQCLPDSRLPAASADEIERRPFNVGLFLSIYVPYAEGPPFVADLHERGGWDAVAAAHGAPPQSTAQLIHPERYPDADPVDVSISDRSSDDWRPIASGGDGEVRTETIGEATLFATLWRNDVIERPLTEGYAERSRYNYSHPATAGWAGDRFRAYQRADEPDRTGHVWRLAWESRADATEFADAYRRLLANRGAERVGAGDGVYRIPDGEAFEGAYRLSVTGETVEIVGAPTVDDLEAIHSAESGSNRSGSEAVLEPATALERTAVSEPTAPAEPTIADRTATAEPAAAASSRPAAPSPIESLKTPRAPADG